VGLLGLKLTKKKIVNTVDSGQAIIKSKIKNIPNSPGIYKFLDEKIKLFILAKLKIYQKDYSTTLPLLD